MMLDRRRRLSVLAICCLSLFIVGLDTTIVNVALPSIQRDLHAPFDGLQWTIDAYTLAIASLLMLSASIADRIGRKRVFLVGLVIFSLGSLLCSLAPNTPTLIVFRIVQAVGGSMLNPVAMSIIINTFTDPSERAKAIGVWGGVVGLSMALGPIVGGALIDSAGWRSIFWLNVPVGIAAFTLTSVFVPESKAPRPRRLDPIAQLLVMTLLATLTYAIIEGPSKGWTSIVIVGCFAVAAGTIPTLVLHERRRSEPLLDLRFFHSVPFSGAIVTAICGFAALGGFLFLNALYLQSVRHFSPLHAGLLTLPMAVMTAIFAPLSGRLVAARGTRLPLLAAGVGITACGLMLTRLTATTPIWYLIVAYVAFGFGFGVLNAPITNSAASGMPRSQAGVAAAVASTSRQVGSALGVAVLGSIVTSRITGTFATGFSAASHLGWAVMTALGVAVFVLGWLTTNAWATRTAATAALLVATDQRIADGGPEVLTPESVRAVVD
jgi:EmrB/QacA subfamily drug resistance transporter